MATRRLRSDVTSRRPKNAATEKAAARKMSTRPSKRKKTVKTPNTSSSTHEADGSLEDPVPVAGASTPWYNFFTKSDPAYNEYMATEWGYEKRDSRGLFEKLSLEGAQAGLSWQTILKKREAYRRTFHGFDVDMVANMTDSDVDNILATDSSGEQVVVRHAGKIRSVINNAKCIIEMSPELEERGMSFGDYIWSFVDDKPILNRWASVQAMPSKTMESEAMSKDLKKRGFRFVGPTTCYSLMQSCGLVIDHVANTQEWHAAKERLENRAGGYQKRY